LEFVNLAVYFHPAGGLDAGKSAILLAVTGLAVACRRAARLVKDHTVVVPASGHWIMKKNPTATTKLVLDFLGS